jgi:hypothetical protein
MCSYTSSELHQRKHEVIFDVLTLFCCLWTYFIVCGFSRTIRTCVCFSVSENYFVVYGLILLFVVLVGLLGLAYAFLFMRIILLFMFTCRNLLVKSPLEGC